MRLVWLFTVRCALVGTPCSQAKSPQMAKSIYGGVNFGTKATTRTAKTLLSLF